VGLAAVALTVPPLAPTALADDLAEDLARQRASRTLSVDPADERASTG